LNHRRTPNAQVLKEMAVADIYVYCSDNWEINKTGIVASLIGLPVANERGRERLGRNIAFVAHAHWHPTIMEARYVAVYHKVLDSSGSKSNAPTSC
jgi:hypothetical protein